MKISDLRLPIELNPNKQEIINKWFKTYLLEGYATSNSNHLENHGDLEELQQMFEHHQAQIDSAYRENSFTTDNQMRIRLNETSLDKFIHICNALMQLWRLIPGNEAFELRGSFKDLRELYPLLYKTAVVWAWG